MGEKPLSNLKTFGALTGNPHYSHVKYDLNELTSKLSARAPRGQKKNRHDFRASLPRAEQIWEHVCVACAETRDHNLTLLRVSLKRTARNGNFPLL